ncbi:MAG TPA: hypothetical protein VFZ66_23015 [Herpetosiphonaceae bacterium]
MAVIAVVPRAVADAGTFAPWSTRMRLLDGANQWQSAAPPWRSIPRPAFVDALARVGITKALPDALPEDLGELLHQLGASQFCTELVLGLTALPGDDLPGVIATRGGVLLLVVDQQERDLLAVPGGPSSTRCWRASSAMQAARTASSWPSRWPQISCSTACKRVSAAWMEARSGAPLGSGPSADVVGARAIPGSP